MFEIYKRYWFVLPTKYYWSWQYYHFKLIIEKRRIRLVQQLWAAYPKSKAWYRLLCWLFGECRHYPVYNNRRSWLWVHTINPSVFAVESGHECIICGQQERVTKYQGNVEFTTDEIREGRKEYEMPLLQPYRQGEFSKEWRDAYPEQAKNMVKDGAITKEQYVKAKEVWKDKANIR